MNERVNWRTERQMSAETGRTLVETLAVRAIASPLFEILEPTGFKQIL